MPVIEISRIQHRRGAYNDLPSALAEGEIGFATDTGSIFMGAPNTPSVMNRTISPFQNIKILTEFDVAYTVDGQVYYHGPLKLATIGNPTPPITVLVATLFDVTVRNSGIYDYSLIPATPTTGAPRRVGTLMVITDGTHATIRDDYQELDTTQPFQTGVQFSVLVNGSNLELHATNVNGLIQSFYYFGREWNAV